MSKRGNKAGTVYESPKGSGRWWAQLSAGPDGRRPRRYAGDGATKEDAERLLRQMHAEREAGRDLSRKADTVKELLDYAIDTAKSQVSPGTVRSRRKKAEHITKRIGAIKIRDVTTETVQRLANDLAGAGLSAGYVITILEQLSSAFQLIIPEKAAYNPVNWKKLKLRKAVKQERQPVDDLVVIAILEAADNVEARGGDARYAIAWWLAALLGLRRSELAALTWADVNWERAELTIRQAYVVDEEGGYELGSTKNRRTRVLPIGPRLLARLRQHWTVQQQERLRHGRDWHKGDFILCNERGDPIDQITVYNRLLRRLCRDAKLPHTSPHQLRHSVATIISEAGYSEAVIASILGHEKGNNVTIRYTHAREKAKRNAVLSVELQLFGASGEVAREAR